MAKAMIFEPIPNDGAPFRCSRISAGEMCGHRAVRMLTAEAVDELRGYINYQGRAVCAQHATEAAMWLEDDDA